MTIRYLELDSARIVVEEEAMRIFIAIFVTAAIVAVAVLLMVGQEPWKLAILYALLPALAFIVRDLFRARSSDESPHRKSRPGRPSN